jgi:hypothetical protein
VPWTEQDVYTVFHNVNIAERDAEQFKYDWRVVAKRDFFSSSSQIPGAEGGRSNVSQLNLYTYYKTTMQVFAQN